MDFPIFDFFAQRHSFYELNNVCPLSEDGLKKLIQKALELYPSPFNSQSARVALLLNDFHQKFWHLTENKLLATAPEDKHQAIRTKIAGFAKSFGTILFFTDTQTTQQLADKFPLYADKFENWAFQCNAILQFMIWSALATENIGASLQHYNPLIDDDIRQSFNISSNWELVAQMPFGGIDKIPAPHLVENIEDKFITLA